MLKTLTFAHFSFPWNVRKHIRIYCKLWTFKFCNLHLNIHRDEVKVNQLEIIDS